MRALGRLIGFLVGLSVKGFFEAGWEGFRRGHPLVKLAVGAAGLAAVSLLGAVGALLVEAVIGGLMLCSREYHWAGALEALLAIPAAWAAGSSLAMSLLGVSPITPLEAAVIMLRFHAAGLAIAYPAATLNPVDAYNAARRLLGPRRAGAVLAAYRLLPHGLTCFREAMESSSVKGAPLPPAIAAATAAVIEEAEGVLEATAWRRSSSPALRVPRSRAWVLLEASATLILVLACILLHAGWVQLP